MEKYSIELSKKEREFLVVIVTKGKRPVAEVRRANILLAVDKGEHGDLRWTDARAAEAYRVTEQTVRNLKRRCCKEGPIASVRRKRSDRPDNVKPDRGD